MEITQTPKRKKNTEKDLIEPDEKGGKTTRTMHKMERRRLRAFRFGCAIGLLFLLHHGRALVITAPRIGNLVGSSSPPWGGMGQKITTSGQEPASCTVGTISTTIRIRATQEADIDAISTLLATAIVMDPSLSGDRNHGWNWKLSLETMQAKTGIDRMLRARIQAITAGHKALARVASATTECTPADMMRMIWSNDGFRSKLEKAAQESDEPHVWRDHNFALAPRDPSWLQHKMMTAEDSKSGEIIGFCEVAMMAAPSETDDKCSETAVPVIMNLVVSSNYRRQGIASGLLRTAERYVGQVWSGSQMGLYVDKRNDPAVGMYSKLGFEKVVSMGSDSKSQWFMIRRIVKPNATEENAMTTR